MRPFSGLQTGNFSSNAAAAANQTQAGFAEMSRRHGTWRVAQTRDARSMTCGLRAPLGGGETLPEVSVGDGGGTGQVTTEGTEPTGASCSVPWLG